jgi:hypothetical protein
MVLSQLAGVFAAMTILAALLVWSRLWPGVVRRCVVWCHEWGHVVAAVLCHGKISGMRLNYETSGVTNFRLRKGRGAKRRRVFVAFCGQISPGVVGLILVACARGGYAYAGLAVLTLFVVGTVLLIRNWWGLALVVLGAGALALCTWLVSPAQAAWPVLAVAMILIWGGLRDIFVAIGNRRRSGKPEKGAGRVVDDGSDGSRVARELHISPQTVEAAWLLVWAATAAGAGAVVFWPT